jgi:hypothetical protein
MISIRNEAMGVIIAFVILLIILICAPGTRGPTMAAIPWLCVLGGGVLLGVTFAGSRKSAAPVVGGDPEPRATGIMASVVTR